MTLDKLFIELESASLIDSQVPSLKNARRVMEAKDAIRAWIKDTCDDAFQEGLQAGKGLRIWTK